jgi:hypothetical protein
MVQYAQRSGVDQLLVAVHPRHGRFYRRFMAFEPVGDERDYPTVCGNPAVALCLDFQRIRHNRPENYDRFFGTALPDDTLVPAPMPLEDASFFAPMVDGTKGLVIAGDSLHDAVPAEVSPAPSRIEVLGPARPAADDLNSQTEPAQAEPAHAEPRHDRRARRLALSAA